MRDRRVHRRADVADERPRHGGRPQQAREPLVVDVVRRALGVRPARAEAAHRRADQMRGWRRRIVAPSTPRRRAVDGRKLSTSTSAREASASRTPRRLRRSQIERHAALAAIEASKYERLASRRQSRSVRMPSPPRGSSILMTSAPRSASSSVAYAPGSSRVRSSTRTLQSAASHLSRSRVLSLGEKYCCGFCGSREFSVPRRVRLLTRGAACCG